MMSYLNLMHWIMISSWLHKQVSPNKWCSALRHWSCLETSPGKELLLLEKDSYAQGYEFSYNWLIKEIISFLSLCIGIVTGVRSTDVSWFLDDISFPKQNRTEQNKTNPWDFGLKGNMIELTPKDFWLAMLLATGQWVLSHGSILERNTSEEYLRALVGASGTKMNQVFLVVFFKIIVYG